MSSKRPPKNMVWFSISHEAYISDGCREIGAFVMDNDVDYYYDDDYSFGQELDSDPARYRLTRSGLRKAFNNNPTIKYWLATTSPYDNNYDNEQNLAAARLAELGFKQVATGINQHHENHEITLWVYRRRYTTKRRPQ